MNEEREEFLQNLDRMARAGASKKMMAAATGKTVKQIDGALRRRFIYGHLPKTLWPKYFPHSDLAAAIRQEKERQQRRRRGPVIADVRKADGRAEPAVATIRGEKKFTCPRCKVEIIIKKAIYVPLHIRISR